MCVHKGDKMHGHESLKGAWTYVWLFQLPSDEIKDTHKTFIFDSILAAALLVVHHHIH
jgi:hypothetical protein